MWTAVFSLFLVSFVFSCLTIWIKSKSHQHLSILALLDDFSDGIFWGIGLFVLWPHLLHAGSDLGYSALHCAAAVLGLGMILFFLTPKHHEESSCAKAFCPSDALRFHGHYSWMMGMLALHSLLEGVALSMVHEQALQAIMLGSLLMHKGLESVVFSHAALARFSQPIALCIALFYAMLTPLGILFGETSWLHHQHHGVFELLIDWVTTTMFLYMAPTCLLRNSKIPHKFFAYVLGLGLVSFLTHV